MASPGRAGLFVRLRAVSDAFNPLQKSRETVNSTSVETGNRLPGADESLKLILHSDESILIQQGTYIFVCNAAIRTEGL